MQYLDEAITAKLYARDVIVAHRAKRGKEVLKPWVSNGVSFGTFLSLMKEKYEHSRKARNDNPPVSPVGEPAPLHKGAY